LILFSPFSPLAASIFLERVESGTVWPSTKPSATSARRNGQGLFGETSIGAAGDLLLPGSGMALDPENIEL
jgi:hypothetical protein